MEKEILISSIKYVKKFTLENWKTVVLVLVVAMATNLYFIKQRLISTKPLVDSDPIFRTYKTIGNSFYQKNDSTKWLFLSGEEILSNGSEIQTDADSHAILSFIGQSGRIELSEKTHLGMSSDSSQGHKNTTIEFKKGEVYINYQAGSVQRPLLVKINDRIFRLINADIYISGNAEEQILVSVEYGKTTMKVAGESTGATFEKGQTILFKEKGYSVDESKFKIKTPFNYDRYNLEHDEYKVRFAFEPFQEKYNFQLFVGTNKENIKPYFEKPKSFEKNEFLVPFKKGSYYWYLGAFDGEKLLFTSHIKKFFVEPQGLIQLVKPLANTKLQLLHGTVNVQFQWDNPSQLEKVFIEVSKLKDFSKTIVHEPISDNNYFSYDFNEVGVYYWRVSGFLFGTSDLLSSGINTIDIVNEVVPQQVKVLFPKGKTVLTTLSLKNSDITFQWTKNPATTIYDVDIRSVNNGKVFHFETKNTELKIKDLLPGTYTWQVSDKRSNIVSPVAEFGVVGTKRLNFAKESEEAGYLSWQSGPRGTARYRVEALRIGSRSDFNAFFDEKSHTKKSLEITGDRISYKNFSAGIYAFKVYALDSEKNILADSDLKFLKVRDKEE